LSERVSIPWSLENITAVLLPGKYRSKIPFVALYHKILNKPREGRKEKLKIKINSSSWLSKLIPTSV